MTDDFDEAAYREKLLKLHPPPPLSSFGLRVHELASRVSENYKVEEIESSRHLFDKVIRIITPGIDMPAEFRTEFDEIARNYLPLAFRCTFEFSDGKNKR